MSGNTFGQLFAVTNFGESHGPAIGCVIDGCPPGMVLSEADIQPDLDRRRPGTSRHVTQRNEPDAVQILSGVYEGKTTGTPIALLIQNTDQRSKDYGNILNTFRPGHADFTYQRKFGIRDPRGGGRSSARLTAPMVAAGAVAKKWLKEKYGTSFRGCMAQIGELSIPFESWEHVPNNPFFAPAADVSKLEAYMDELRKAGDSCGARIRVTATGVPVGLGEPLYDKLDADIAWAMIASMRSKVSRSVRASAASRNAAPRTATRCRPKALRATMPVACSAASAPGRIWKCPSPSSPPARSAARASPSTCRAILRWSRPSAATTPVSVSAPRRLPRPCWRWW